MFKSITRILGSSKLCVFMLIFFRNMLIYVNKCFIFCFETLRKVSFCGKKEHDVLGKKFLKVHLL